MSRRRSRPRPRSRRASAGRAARRRSRWSPGARPRRPRGAPARPASIDGGVGDVDPRPHDVVERRAGLGERAPDDLEADRRLLVGVVGRVGVARHDRRGAGDPDRAADPDGARVADAFLECGSRGDELTIHTGSVEVVEALRQVEGWPCAQCRSRGRVPGRGRDHTRRRERPFALGLRDEARDGGGGARRGRGGDRRSRRPGRPAGLDAPPPARARLGPAVRRRRAARRSPGRGGSTRTAGSSCRRPRRRGRRDAVRGVLRRRLGLPARRARRPTASRRRSNALVAVARSCSRPTPRGRDARRGRRRCSSPGSPASCPASAARSRTTGASASSCATASRPTGRARATRRGTFGHFGRAGGFLWVDPGAGVALACLTDLDFGDWAKDAWPQLADAVLAESLGPRR